MILVSEVSILMLGEPLLGEVLCRHTGSLHRVRRKVAGAESPKYCSGRAETPGLQDGPGTGRRAATELALEVELRGWSSSAMPSPGAGGVSADPSVTECNIQCLLVS